MRGTYRKTCFIGNRHGDGVRGGGDASVEQLGSRAFQRPGPVLLASGRPACFGAPPLPRARRLRRLAAASMAPKVRRKVGRNDSGRAGEVQTRMETLRLVGRGREGERNKIRRSHMALS